MLKIEELCCEKKIIHNSKINRLISRVEQLKTMHGAQFSIWFNKWINDFDYLLLTMFSVACRFSVFLFSNLQHIKYYYSTRMTNIKWASTQSRHTFTHIQYSLTIYCIRKNCRKYIKCTMQTMRIIPICYSFKMIAVKLFALHIFQVKNVPLFDV